LDYQASSRFVMRALLEWAASGDRYPNDGNYSKQLSGCKNEGTKVRPLPRQSAAIIRIYNIQSWNHHGATDACVSPTTIGWDPTVGIQGFRSGASPRIGSPVPGPVHSAYRYAAC
jgi:hypothetical protein